MGCLFSGKCYITKPFVEVVGQKFVDYDICTTGKVDVAGFISTTNSNFCKTLKDQIKNEGFKTYYANLITKGKDNTATTGSDPGLAAIVVWANANQGLTSNKLINKDSVKVGMDSCYCGNWKFWLLFIFLLLLCIGGIVFCVCFFIRRSRMAAEAHHVDAHHTVVVDGHHGYDHEMTHEVVTHESPHYTTTDHHYDYGH